MTKFLLVSESKTFLKRNTALLQRRGIQLFTTTSGEEALKLHDDYQFDMILADLELEDMDGFTLCSQVRKKDTLNKVPVIITGHKTKANLERVEQSGVSAMLVKPIDPFELVDTIGKVTNLQMVRHKRVELDVKVLINAGDAEMICESYDISSTGILLMTGMELVLGWRVICRFTLPGSINIEVDGEIIRSMSTLKRKSLYGIKFINVLPSNRIAIDEYVRLVQTLGLVDKNIPLMKK